MPDQTPSKKSPLRDLKPLWLLVEREVLRQALAKHGWNQSRTAPYLNITRSALIYRMHKYGLQQPEL
jgi:DNA-binding NtrC family response regulator